MKTFLKVVLLLLAAILALKLLPLTFALGCLVAGGLLGLVALGVSVVAALVGALLVVAAVLSPIWLPILIVVGLIALIKRSSRGTSPRVSA